VPAVEPPAAVPLVAEPTPLAIITDQPSEKKVTTKQREDLLSSGLLLIVISPGCLTAALFLSS